MRRLIPWLFSLLILPLVILPISNQARPIYSPPIFSSSSDLVAAVNALRAEHGLPPYSPNPILMGIAQAQSEYLAAIGVSTTHVDSFGRRPFQRALDAGYAVAGDLTRGGFFSENVVGGVGLTAEGAVEIWMGDAPHQNTMLSTALQDVGAGVAVVGNTYYYVLDCGLSTGGTPVAYTQPPYVVRSTTPLATNTPGEDGSILHIVQSGDTLLAIAIAYDLTLGELYALNGLNDNSVIYPDQQIIVRASYTATPTQPTSTPTTRPSSTPWPTSQSASATPPPAPSLTPQPTPTTTNSAGTAVIVIILAALVSAGLVTFLGARHKIEK